mgnify:CR=1 FL=1
MFKTITTFSMALLAAGTMGAAVNAKFLNEPYTLGESFNASMPKLTTEQQRFVVGGCINSNYVVTGSLNSFVNLNMKKANKPAREEGSTPDIISERPEGDESLYCRSGQAMLNFYGWVTMANQTGCQLHLVTAPDGKTVYIQDPITHAASGSWVYGVKEDNQLKIPVGQYTAYNATEELGTQLYAGHLIEVTDENGSTAYSFEKADIDNIIFNIQDDGSLRLEDIYF